jgi:NADH-quinone oxidoreductase subunit E
MDDGKIDKILANHKGDAGSLIQLLLEIQHENHWLSKDILEKVSRELDVPLSRVRHAATFFKSLRVVPDARHEVHVCNGTGCHIRGASGVIDSVHELIGIAPGETDGEMRFSLETTTCMGRCASGPVMTVDGEHHGKVAPAKAKEVLNGYS